MNIRSSLRLTAACALIAACPQTADAEFFPSRTFHYQFLPRASVLNQSGGFAGVDINWRVRGTFDFSITQSPLAISPPFHYAEFENVEAWGAHPHRDELLDLNDALNLEAIIGGQTIYPQQPPRAFTFHGTTGDGSSVRLQAIMEGPWFYLRGGTTPPPGSADYFKFTIRAMARRTPVADLNDDGVVDRNDAASWSTQFGSPLSGADFLEWQRQLGEAAPSVASMDAALDAAIAASANSAATTVPEPGAMIIAAIAMIVSGGQLRRKRSPQLSCATTA
jgi:hypothetical protein